VLDNKSQELSPGGTSQAIMANTQKLSREERKRAKREMRKKRGLERPRKKREFPRGSRKKKIRRLARGTSKR